MKACFKERIENQKLEDASTLPVLDLLEYDNPQSVVEFTRSILAHLSEGDQKYPSNFMENQNEIDFKKRSYLVDYLIEVHYKFKLKQETLYIIVDLVDRYFMREADVPKKDLQVLGITALHIAAKYEEIYPPSLNKLIRVTQSNTTKQEVIEMEIKMLTVLDFDILLPSAFTFLERFCRLIQVKDKVFFLAQYFCEFALMDKTLVSFQASKIAAISLFTALRLDSKNEMS